MAQKKLKIRQIRSANNRPWPQSKVLTGLGLNKLHQVRELEDTAAVRGMIRKVSHLVEVVEG